MDKNPSLLIVDDEPTALYMMEVLLAPDDYNIAFASSGQEALQKVEESPPDVILLDVMMPQMTGYETCRILKSDTRWRHIPVTLVTALTSKNDLVEGLNAGADEFLSKPVSATELRARIRSMLRIKRQYDELQEALNLREEMAHMLAHDMRSPISSIILYCDLLINNIESILAAGEDPGARLSSGLETIRTQGNRLNSLISDLLMMAKMRSGQLMLQKTPVAIKKLVDGVVQDYQLRAGTRNIDITVDMPEDDAVFMIDNRLITRTMDNLLGNALKFSPRDSTIEIKLQYCAQEQESDSRFCLQVLDNGPGVPPAYREKIFDQYEVAPLNQKGVVQTGLGLAFCKMVVGAHDGRIQVHDNEPYGSVFSIEVNARQMQRQAAPVETESATCR